MSALTTARLMQSVEAWQTYREAEPDDAFRRERQVAYLLVLPKPEVDFYPLRLILTHVTGTPFKQQGGRSIKMQHPSDVLQGLGLAFVTEGSASFDEVYDIYHNYCADRGKSPANHSRSSPRTGRIFWLLSQPVT